MRTGGPQGAGPKRSPNGDKKPVPGAGRWPCLHTRWPGSADKTIRGHDLRGSARSDATPPTDAAMPMQLHRRHPPARCPHSAVNTASADVRSRAEQGLRVPRSPTSPEAEAILPSATGAASTLRVGPSPSAEPRAVVAGVRCERKNRHRAAPGTRVASGLGGARQEGRGPERRAARRVRSPAAQDWTGSRTFRGQVHDPSAHCFKNQNERETSTRTRIPEAAVESGQHLRAPASRLPPGPTRQGPTRQGPTRVPRSRGPTADSDSIDYREFWRPLRFCATVSAPLC